MANEPSLGKTLSSVFAKTPRKEQPAARGYREVELGSVVPPAANPRQHFDQEALDELAASISEHGILQPIVVLKRPAGGYEVLAGERRYRAARQLGLKTVPVVIKDELDDRTVAELRLIENIQRQDLDAIELAQAYRSLIDEHRLTQDELAVRLGKARTSVANHLRLLNLPAPVQAQVGTGALSMGHARALLGLTDAAVLVTMAERCAAEGLSVRQVEQLVREQTAGATAAQAPSPTKTAADNPNLRELESNLERLFGAKVAIKERGGKGSITIGFHSKGHFKTLIDQLDAAFKASGEL